MVKTACIHPVVALKIDPMYSQSVTPHKKGDHDTCGAQNVTTGAAPALKHMGSQEGPERPEGPLRGFMVHMLRLLGDSIAFLKSHMNHKIEAICHILL